jgi:hypothetical protein
MVLFVLGYSDSSRVKTSHVQVSRYFIFFHINSSDFLILEIPTVIKALTVVLSYIVINRLSLALPIEI